MKKEKPKLLIHSNANWASTGYGQQTALITPRLAEDYTVQVSAFYGLEGAPVNLGGTRVLPGMGQNFGNQALPGHAANFFGEPRGGTILTLMDVWVLEPLMIASHNVACWTPVDHDPVPPMVREFFKRSGAVPIAMSKFGQEQLEEWGALYCPHAVDLEIFRPLDQKECRQAAQVPEDAFIIGVVAANKGWPSRKCLPQILEAFSIFHERHSDAVLYMHTDIRGTCEGCPLPPLIDALGLKDKAVLFTDEYRYNYDPYPPATMARAYNAMDVLMGVSMGEGFGVPVLEAGACGVPSIVSDFSAQPEVLGAGYLVEGKRVWTKQSSWGFDPSIEDMVEALERSYAAPQAEREAMKRRAVSHAATYEVGRVCSDHMLPALAEVRERFAGKSLEVVAA